jgi:methionyl-tRNA formyltransferase
MGSPEFAVPSLDALVESGHYRPALVVTQPDRPRGRGRALCATPVRARATQLGIEIVTMTRDTYASGAGAVRGARPEMIVVVAFGLILGRDLLDLPAFGCINVHASLLPRHRGVSPVQAAILAGDALTGCTTMRIDEGIDTGLILLSEEAPILPEDTAGTLSRRLSLLGAHLLVRTIDGVFAGSIEPRSQDPACATHTRKIRKKHGAVDWTKDAAFLSRFVRAMSPWPSAYTFHRGRRIIVEEAREASPGAVRAAPGTVISVEPLLVSCGDGALEIRLLRPEGRRVMTPAEYRAGNAVDPGDVLGPGGAD